jgi:hypothetical protein
MATFGFEGRVSFMRANLQDGTLPMNLNTVPSYDAIFWRICKLSCSQYCRVRTGWPIQRDSGNTTRKSNTTIHSTVILSFISCSSKWSTSNSFSLRNPSANLSSSSQVYLAHLLSLMDAGCRKSYYVLRFISSTLFLPPFFRRNAFSAFRDLIQSISVSSPCLRPYIIAYTFM